MESGGISERNLADVFIFKKGSFFFFFSVTGLNFYLAYACLALSSIAAVSSLLSGQCSSIGGQLCDYHFIGENMTWKEAKDYCKGNHTDLATVSNQTDMKRLHDSATAKFPQYQGGAWIGLQENTPNIVWHWSLPGVEFNETESESEWSPGQPDNKGCVNSRRDNCVRMNDGTWHDDSCSKLYNFICYDGENMWCIESVLP
uniref:C-type lectin domain-containing protein n=1 Tax=Sander lucioperca TaxID=283035 RepID=A0A8C9XAC9_SANLU